jgi:putative ABC transport system ATP-binding protein
MRPKVMLADEPTGNLDTSSGGEVVELLEALNREGLTLIVVTHDPVIGRRSRLHLRMKDGEIVSATNPASGSGDETA